MRKRKEIFDTVLAHAISSKYSIVHDIETEVSVAMKLVVPLSGMKANQAAVNLTPRS